jgi:hypothetical protein
VAPSLNDTLIALEQARDEFLAHWSSLPPTTRVLVVLTVILGLMYVGSKAEQTGFSAMMFLSAFALFAYLFALGYALLG